MNQKKLRQGLRFLSILGLVIFWGCGGGKNVKMGKGDMGMEKPAFYVWNHGYVHGHIQKDHPDNPMHMHSDEYCDDSKSKPMFLKEGAYETKALVLAHDVDDFMKLVSDVKKERLMDVPVHAVNGMGKKMRISMSYNDFIMNPWEKSLSEVGFKGERFWTGSGMDGMKDGMNNCGDFTTDDESKKGTYSLMEAKSSVGMETEKEDGSPFYVGKDPKTGQVYSHSCYDKDKVALLCLSYPKNMEMMDDMMEDEGMMDEDMEMDS